MSEIASVIRKKSIAVIITAIFSMFFIYLMTGFPDNFSEKDNFVPPHARIVAFGDSLTAGYNLPLEGAFPAHLQKILQEKGYDVEVINQGISGDTTSMALRRLARVLELQPDIVILELGANDVLKRQSLENARENLVFMITTMKERGIVVLLAGLMSPEYLPIGVADDDFYLSIAQETGVTLYPNFMKGIYDKRIIPTDLVLPDKVHPTSAGARLIAENITPYIERTLQAYYAKVRKQNKTTLER